MSGCRNCPGPNVVHQHVEEGGQEMLARAVEETRRRLAKERKK